MTTTPVGMRCPECSRQTTQVATCARSTRGRRVTIALIAINVLIFFGSPQSAGSGRAFTDCALFGPAVADGEY